MSLSSLTDREAEIYEIALEQAEDVYGDFRQCEDGSDTYREAILLAKVLGEVLEDEDRQIERQAAQWVRKMEGG